MIDTKRILIYGDSLTWGRVAQSTERYGNDIRFTKVLQSQMGLKYEVIEEGLRGRFAKGENPYFLYRNGYEQFPGIFLSHLPINLLVIFLGINDTNKKAEKAPETTVLDLESYIPLTEKLSQSLNFLTPKILFIAPPHIQEQFLGKDTMFAGAENKSKKLNQLIKDMTKTNNVEFFDSNTVVKTCKTDGVHLDKESNIILGKALAIKLKTII